MLKTIKNILTHPIVRNDGGWYGAAATLGASLIGGISGASSQSSANSANMRIAAQNRKFQKDMSNTAHYREVLDLKRAGLNPMLSAMGSGSSTPAGSSATMQAADPLAGIGGAVSSAMEVKKLSNELKIQKAQETQLKSQTSKTNTETNLLKANEPVAQVKNQLGQMAIKEVQSLRSSAKDTQTNLKSWVKHFSGSSAKDLLPTRHHRQKAERKARANYKLSPAARDAAKIRQKRLNKIKRSN